MSSFIKWYKSPQHNWITNLALLIFLFVYGLLWILWAPFVWVYKKLRKGPPA